MRSLVFCDARGISSREYLAFYECGLQLKKNCGIAIMNFNFGFPYISLFL